MRNTPVRTRLRPRTVISQDIEDTPNPRVGSGVLACGASWQFRAARRSVGLQQGVLGAQIALHADQ
jgi:hypothetical protein